KKLKTLLKENGNISVKSTSNSYHQSKVESKQKEIQNKIQNLNDIKNEFTKQFSNKDVHQRGYVLEEIISSLFKLNRIRYNDSYRNSPRTQQVDGYSRFEEQANLVETKWKKKAINSAE